jgi:NAD(P)-dependent dehydrogenase (short-subunit alcohol dehydrogenase family)
VNFELFDMRGKYALITGAAGFLGKTHSMALAEIGFNLVLTDLDLERLKLLRDKILDIHPSIHVLIYRMDVTSKSQIEGVYAKLEDESICISALINNAAINPVERDLAANNRFESFDIDMLRSEMEVGIIGAVNCSQVFGRQMLKKSYGSIINIGSDLSIISPNQNLYFDPSISVDEQKVKPVSYSIVKTAILGFTRYLSTYLAPSNIRVNTISPGGIFNDHNEDFNNRISKLIPLGRMGLDWEVKGALQFLSSDASTYVTGQNLVIDGGRTIW